MPSGEPAAAKPPPASRPRQPLAAKVPVDKALGGQPPQGPGPSSQPWARARSPWRPRQPCRTSSAVCCLGGAESSCWGGGSPKNQGRPLLRTLWLPQHESTAHFPAPPRQPSLPLHPAPRGGRGPDLGPRAAQGAAPARPPRPRLAEETQASQLRRPPACSPAPSPGTMPGARPCVWAAAAGPSPRQPLCLQTSLETGFPGERTCLPGITAEPSQAAGQDPRLPNPPWQPRGSLEAGHPAPPCPGCC